MYHIILPFSSAPLRQSKPIRFLCERIGKLPSQFEGFLFPEPVFDDEPRQEGAIHSSGNVMTRRYRRKGARVVVETDRIVEAGGFRREFAETAHAFGAVVEPPGRPQLQRW